MRSKRNWFQMWIGRQFKLFLEEPIWYTLELGVVILCLAIIIRIIGSWVLNIIGF